MRKILILLFAFVAFAAFSNIGGGIGAGSQDPTPLDSDKIILDAHIVAPYITLDTEFGTYSEVKTVHVTVENMPENGTIKYQLVYSNAQEEWRNYDEAKGIIVNRSAALTVIVYDADGEELARVEGEFTINLPTGLESISTNTADDNWYNIQGVKFNGMPSAPGIYIHNGRKVVIN